MNVRRRENKENAGRPGAQSQSERERADSRGRRDLNAPPERGARPNALSTQPAVLTTASKRALVSISTFKKVDLALPTFERVLVENDFCP